MANEYIWVDTNEREVQVSGPATAAFEAGYTDKQIGVHKGTHPLDHPDGSVTPEKLHEEVYACFAKKSDTDAHIAGRANPHGVTKAQVGLGNADNTADMDKPISTAVRTALDTKQEKEAGKGLSEENYTAAEKEKLAGVETGANAYTHPQTHAAAMIEQDDSHRFVTAAEKEAWNAKAAPSDIQAGENVSVSVENGKVTISATGGGEGDSVTITDDLTSRSAVIALSANQGRVLDEKIAEVQETVATKAPIFHASEDGTYGLGSQTQYGHVKLRGDLNAQTTGEAALDAAMGYVLKQAVDGKPDLDDIIAGENITVETVDGKVTVSAAAGGGAYGGQSEYISNHNAGTTYTNNIPVPEGANYALVFVTNRKRPSDNIGEQFGIMCYINKSINDVVVMGHYDTIAKVSMWRYSMRGFITGTWSSGNTTYINGRQALGVDNSYITSMELTNNAITMTVEVGQDEDGDSTGKGYVVDWVVWK